jgi:hypothetical protein
MGKCKEKKVNWAIFSDKYGVWFPSIKHRWYDKSPDEVTLVQFIRLVNDFEQKLQDYDEIWFYHNPGRFHHVYQMLLQVAKPEGKIIPFTHIDEIE